MRALLLNWTMKPSPAASNTEALTRVVWWTTTCDPGWIGHGQRRRVAQRVLERMDAMLSEQDDSGRPWPERG